MNKKVSMNSFLKKYLCHLSGQDSLKMNVLVDEANQNERIRMPLYLYVNENAKEDLFDRKASKELKSEYAAFINELREHESYDKLYEFKGKDLAGNDEFCRTYKTFVYYRDDFKNTKMEREEMFKVFRKAIESNKITKYQLCKVAGVRMQNFNKAYNNNDYSKVSYDKCERMLDYLVEIGIA